MNHILIMQSCSLRNPCNLHVNSTHDKQYYAMNVHVSCEPKHSSLPFSMSDAPHLISGCLINTKLYDAIHEKLHVTCATLCKRFVCSKHAMQHSKEIKYCICFTNIHMKCLSRKLEDHDYLQINTATSDCVKCTSALLSLNNNVDYTLVHGVNRMNLKLLSHCQTLY